MPLPVVDVRGLTVAFGGLTVFEDVSFSLDAGQSLALVGPSGCGKSSLLACLLGLLAPRRGSVHIAGEEISKLGRAASARIRRERIGTVFQDGELLPDLTPIENVVVPAFLAGRERESALGRARDLLAALGVDDRGGASHTLSGGERQRVALARALINRPALVLADEPTGSLDGATRESVADVLFSACAEWNCALLVVTHEPAVAARAQRVATLSAAGVEVR